LRQSLRSLVLILCTGGLFVAAADARSYPMHLATVTPMPQGEQSPCPGVVTLRTAEGAVNVGNAVRAVALYKTAIDALDECIDETPGRQVSTLLLESRAEAHVSLGEALLDARNRTDARVQYLRGAKDAAAMCARVSRMNSSDKRAFYRRVFLGLLVLSKSFPDDVDFAALKDADRPTCRSRGRRRIRVPANRDDRT
jgi:hypothetical protein